MKTARTLLSALIVAGACLPMAAQAQVVREDGVKSIAGVFHTAAGNPTQAEWTFRSTGGQILFASLDADIYRKFSEHGETVVAAAAEGGGCSDEEGGPGLFKLKVFDAYGTEPICSASRPAPPPGWMRDARLACEITSPGTYRLQVEFSPPHEEGELVQPAYPFLLNISLRKIAPTGTNIQSAIAASTAGGF